MPKLPVDTLKVRSQAYTLDGVVTNDLSSQETIGRFNPWSNVITYPSNSPECRQAEILCHEAVHAMLAGYGIEDEVVATTLGEALPLFLADNPRFIKWVQKVVVS